MRYFGAYISIVVVLFAVACNSTNTTYTPSDDPTVATMTFASNDSFPALAKAVFTIEDRIDTGIIYNVDSLTYGTRIDSVVPRFTFNGAVVSAAILYAGPDTIVLTGGDTINFTYRPVLMHTISETGEKEKWYEIYVNVHTTDPDLYQWDKIADNIMPTSYANQKAVILQDTIYWFVSNGLETKLKYSVDAVNWTELIVPFVNFDVQNIIATNEYILCYNDNQLALLTNVNASWKIIDMANLYDFTIEQLVFFFNNKVWAIVKDIDGTEYSMATTTLALTEWNIEQTLPDDFPISDFAETTFLSPTGRQRAMLVGGFGRNGESLNTRWNVEYNPSTGYKWENFSIAQPSFSAITGVSIISYNKQFFLFGGVDVDNKIGEYNMLESYDEGMNWYVPDSTHNCLPDTYRSRAYQSVLTDSKNNIYIIGGKSRIEVFSDVYKGRLNSIDW